MQVQSVPVCVLQLKTRAKYSIDFDNSPPSLENQPAVHAALQILHTKTCRAADSPQHTSVRSPANQTITSSSLQAST